MGIQEDKNKPYTFFFFCSLSLLLRLQIEVCCFLCFCCITEILPTLSSQIKKEMGNGRKERATAHSIYSLTTQPHLCFQIWSDNIVHANNYKENSITSYDHHHHHHPWLFTTKTRTSSSPATPSPDSNGLLSSTDDSSRLSNSSEALRVSIITLVHSYLHSIVYSNV